MQLNAHRPSRPSNVDLLSPGLVLASLASLFACSGSSNGALSGVVNELGDVLAAPSYVGLPPGTVVENPDAGPGESQRFIVDPSSAGFASDVRLLGARWGRLVNVYGQTAAGARTFEQRDFVISDALVSDGADYLVETDTISAEDRLVILRDVSDTSPGGGLDQFGDLLRDAEANLVPIADVGLPNTGTLFSLMPRNGALVLQFDDLLDEETIESETVRLVTGIPPVSPFEARIRPDGNHGDLAQHAGDVAPRFYTSRVLVDMTVSELEAFDSNPPLPVNRVGLPPSVRVDASNTVVRIPTVVDFAIGQDELLRNPAGNGLTTIANGTFDPSTSTMDIVRAMRSGGPSATTGDPDNGFLADDTPPRVVGVRPIQALTRAVADPTGGPLDFVIPRLEFPGAFCSYQPRVGDVLRLPAFVLEVTERPRVRGLAVFRLSVRVVAGNPDELPDSTVGPALITTAFDPVEDAGRQNCYVRVSPTAGGAPALPTRDISTASTLAVGFSEPVSPEALNRLETLILARTGAPSASSDYVAGVARQSVDLTELTFVPDFPLAHQSGLAEPYFLDLASDVSAPRDLAGNALLDALPTITMSVAPGEASESNGGRLVRFRGPDEDPPVDGSSPEWSGQLLYDLAGEAIRSRPVTRFDAIADRTQPVPALMSASVTGVQTPLSPLGSKLQTVWRYIDFTLSLQDLKTINIDVEGLNWAPLDGQVAADQFDEFEIRLAHSKRLPDEVIDPGTLWPRYPQSGMRKVYASNLLESADPQKVVHPRFLGYTVNPGDLFVTSTGTKMLPFPLNRGIPQEEFRYYTWRDTALEERGGKNSSGADPLQYLFALGQTPPAEPLYNANEVGSIGLPLLMEFRCYPDAGAMGPNSFDVSLAMTSSSRPYFRAYSSGGVDQSGTIQLVDPDLETEANGGFNSAGQATYGLDPTFYVGSVDVVVRISRAYSLWYPAVDPAGGLFASPSYLPPHIDPAPQNQPDGTQITFAFRGATAVTNDDALTDASTMDAYGDHYDDRGLPQHDADRANLGIAFLASDATWKETAEEVDGASYYQLRATFSANPVSGQTPILRALAQAWQ